MEMVKTRFLDFNTKSFRKTLGHVKPHTHVWARPVITHTHNLQGWDTGHNILLTKTDTTPRHPHVLCLLVLLLYHPKTHWLGLLKSVQITQTHPDLHIASCICFCHYSRQESTANHVKSISKFPNIQGHLQNCEILCFRAKLLHLVHQPHTKDF